MLPKWHIFWGVILVAIFKLTVPSMTYISLFLLWFASVFIDFDHYLVSAIKTGNWSPIHAVKRNYSLRNKIVSLGKKSRACERGDFHIFHTLEAHLIIGIVSIFLPLVFFAFIGMVFHSFLDIIWMVKNDVLESREFFLLNRIRETFF